MSLLIEYPILAAAIGGLWLLLYGMSRRPSGAIAALAWLAYAAYETGMRRRWLCTGECNIRVDLLLISPLLWILTIASVVQLIRRRRDGPA